MTFGRWRTAAVAGVLAIGLGAAGLVGAHPAYALSSLDPIDEDYEQSALCLKDQRALDSLPTAVGWAQRDLGFNAVSHLSQGAGVTVAVLDTGVNPHPAFGDRLLPGGDLLWAAAPSPGLMDCDGHGSIVAGILGGSADPQTGYTGVAPAARILSIRVTSQHYTRKGQGAASGSSQRGVGTAEQLAAALDKAVGAGAKVVNISAALCGPALSTTNESLQQAVARATAADVVVVAAAGNVSADGCTPQNSPGAAPVTAPLPGRIESVVTVGATQQTGAVSDFSLAGPWVDLAAPGESLTTVNPHPDRTGQVDRILGGEGTIAISGTSYAAPYVAGTAALVRARFPRLTADQVARRLTATASHPAGDIARNDSVGAGVVNPRRALTAVLPEEGAAGTPVPVAQQGVASGASASPSASSQGPGVAAESDDLAMPALPPAADPFAGRLIALLAAGSILAAVALAVLQRQLRRRSRGARPAAPS